MKHLCSIKVATNFFLIFALFCTVHVAAQMDRVKLQEQILSFKANELAALNHSKSTNNTDWYSQAVAKLQKMEYSFAQGADAYSFTAFNRINNLGFLMYNNGYKVKNSLIGNEKEKQWEIDFITKGWGRQSSTNLFKYISSKNKDGNLIYECENSSIEYINNPDGVRQNFILNQKPKGQGMLEVQLKINTALHIKSKKEKISFFENDNLSRAVMSYSNLKVWDANKQPLNAYMELRTGNLLALVINDAHAVYPITVDPLNTAADWENSSSGLLYSTFNDGVLSALYGFSVSTAGKLNNDIYDDVIIGSPGYVHILNLSGGTFEIVSAGAAFVYFGSATGPAATPSEVLQPSAGSGVLGTINPALFGISVSGAGDINGDGFGDVIIGAPGERISLEIGLNIPISGIYSVPTLVAVGKAYVYYGSSMDGNVNTIPAPQAELAPNQNDFGAVGLLLSVPANPLYGFSVSNAGDLNADGYADVIVGSPAYVNILNLTSVGRVSIYYGSSAGLTGGHTIDATGLVNLLFGYTVSTAGNVNKDSLIVGGIKRPLDDIIVGAPGSLLNVLNGVTGGGAYVFHGASGGISANTTGGANTTLNGGGILNLVNGLYGNTVSDAGDVNKDGYSDVIVGEPLSTQLLGSAVLSVGKAYIHYGSATGIKQAGATVLTSPRAPGLLGGIAGNLLFGFSVSSLGDVNCDGIDDVIVGEPGSTAVSLFSGALSLVNAQVVSGASYIYYGKQSTGPVNTPGGLFREIDPLSVANLLGANVAGAGDVNGDGKNDILTGAPNGTINLGASLLSITGNLLSTLITSNASNGAIGKSYVHFGRCPVQVNLQVYIDADGTQSKASGEPGSNVSGSLVLTIVDRNTGAVVSSTPIAADGTLSITVPEKGNYDFVVSTTTFVAGEKYTAPSTYLPTNYVNTSPNNGIISVTNANVATPIIVNVGIEQLPQSDFKTNILNPVALFFRQNLANMPLTGSDPEDSPAAGSFSAGRSFRVLTIPAAADATLYYNEVPVVAGTIITNYNPAILKIAFNRADVATVNFTYASIDAAGQQDPTPATYNIVPAIILPLNGLVLSANQNGSGVVLNWQAKGETSVTRYQVERSLNGNTFTAIANVAARNNNAASNDYAFIDPLIASSTVWYRVVQYKTSGSVVVSNQVVVKPNGNSQPGITINPTIVRDIAQLRVQSSNGGLMQLQVTDMSGRIVMKKQVSTSAGTTTIPLDGWQNLGNGMYSVTIKGEGFHAMQKIIVQH